MPVGESSRCVVISVRLAEEGSSSGMAVGIATRPERFGAGMTGVSEFSRAIGAR